MKRLILVGGGHSHVEVLRAFGRRAAPNTELILVSPDRYTPYSGMLPGWIAGHYTSADCHIDLAQLVQFAAARFVPLHVTAIALRDREVRLEDGTVLGYDVCSINIGSTSPVDAIAGAGSYAVPVKPVKALINALEALTVEVKKGRRLHIALIGAGAAGVEVLLSVQYRLQGIFPAANLTYSLLTATSFILPGHAKKMREIFLRILAERQVALLTDFTVRSIDEHIIRAVDGRVVEADFIIVATGAAAASWPTECGIDTDGNGFIKINEHLQTASDPSFFAAGDIASMPGSPYSKSGVYAVRQGPVLAVNLRNALTNRPFARYIPQRQALALITTGTRYAVASKGPWALEGHWVWTWKDYIDRRFISKYNRAPAR
jgi:selenide, water dikinase